MPRVAILGATGAVGSTLLRVLEERTSRSTSCACWRPSARPARRCRYGGKDVTRAGRRPRSFDGIDIAIFSAGATRSREWAPHAIGRGAVVVDNSSAFRMEDGVPLVVADVNPHAARAHAAWSPTRTARRCS